MFCCYRTDKHLRCNTSIRLFCCLILLNMVRYVSTGEEMTETALALDYREPEWVAEKLGLDKNTVYKYLQEGWLPGVQLGRKWLISERLLAEHLEKETRAQTAARRKELPQTPRLKRTIELAGKYAAGRGQHVCGTDNVLIGIIHETE